jgi:hypothetical protein
MLYSSLGWYCALVVRIKHGNAMCNFAMTSSLVLGWGLKIGIRSGKKIKQLI